MVFIYRWSLEEVRLYHFACLLFPGEEDMNEYDLSRLQKPVGPPHDPQLGYVNPVMASPPSDPNRYNELPHTGKTGCSKADTGVTIVTHTFLPRGSVASSALSV